MIAYNIQYRTPQSFKSIKKKFSNTKYKDRSPVNTLLYHFYKRTLTLQSVKRYNIILTYFGYMEMMLYR